MRRRLRPQDDHPSGGSVTEGSLINGGRRAAENAEPEIEGGAHGGDAAAARRAQDWAIKSAMLDRATARLRAATRPPYPVLPAPRLRAKSAPRSQEERHPATGATITLKESRERSDD